MWPTSKGPSAWQNFDEIRAYFEVVWHRPAGLLRLQWRTALETEIVNSIHAYSIQRANEVVSR